MTKKKESRSTNRSKRLIRNAFLELLSERDFSKITVTDIAERADLNRSTFYAHYPDIIGIIEEFQEENLCKHLNLIQSMGYINIFNNPVPYLENLALLLEENLKLYTKIGHTEQLHHYLDKYRKLLANDIIHDPAIPEEIRQSPFFPIRIHFFLGGIMNSYQQWSEGNLDCSLQELSHEIAEVITSSGKDLLSLQ